MKRRALFFLLPVAAAQGLVAASDIPDTLAVPGAHVLVLSAKAEGVQIYACKPAASDPAHFEWALQAPEAKLLDGDGRQIGRHYAGPTWESGDGSRVVGELKAKDSGPDANAIPWLLLAAKAHSGSGVFADALWVQRVHTHGGKAPVQGCAADQSGHEARIPYTATYNFYRAGPG